MPIAKDSGGKEFVPAPAGSHLARCISVISLGTQHNETFGSDAFKVMLTWELPNETVRDSEGNEVPFIVSKDYTLSLNPKAKLRQHLESWRGRSFTDEELKGFAVEKILGQPCMLTIVHDISGKGKTYAQVASVGGIPKGMTAPAQYHKTIHYELEMKRGEVFASLPEWVQKKINNCLEWNGGPVREDVDTDSDPPGEDTPF